MNAGVLVLNAGSSSLKFALFREGALGPERRASGSISRIGRSDSSLRLKSASGPEATETRIQTKDHASCLESVWDAMASAARETRITAVAHRIVQGGPRYFEPQRITPEMLAELHRLSPFDPQHLPAEVSLIEAVSANFSQLPQFACFDTAFHHDLPRVARVLPIPRRLEAAGVRRYGFHGLSFHFLLNKLRELGDSAATRGRVILAHLGNGVSLAAVRDGRCIDTSMGFTPSAGLMMGTRSGDLDPGLVAYLATTEKMSAEAFARMINHESGLLGISETSSDMRELLGRETKDVRAAEAVELFCYTAKKWVGGYIAALGGISTLVFAGGIGENCPPIRERVCTGLEFAGITIDHTANGQNAAVISDRDSRVTVRVISTDEELVIARATFQHLEADDARPHEQ
jgi:acetate kinase